MSKVIDINNSLNFINDYNVSGTNSNSRITATQLGQLLFYSTSNATNSSSGTITLLNGGMGINSTINALNHTNGGALTIAGGASIGKDVFIGGTTNTSVLILNNPSIGPVDVLNLNNGNLIGANSIRITDPGVNNEGLFFDGGNLWQISEASNALVNTSGNLQIIINGTRTATFETTGNFYIAGRISSGSVITSTLTTGQLSTINISSSTLNASTGITTGILLATSITTSHVFTTDISSATINVSTGITTGTLLATNIKTTNLSTSTLIIGSGITTSSLYITNGSLNANFNNNTIGTIYTTGGNVGINNTSPNYTLDITGQLYVNSENNTSILTANNSSEVLQIKNANNAGNSSIQYLDTAGSQKLYIGYGNTSSNVNYAGMGYILTENSVPIRIIAGNNTGSYISVNASDNSLSITTTTNSIDTSSGSLKISGGVGVVKSLNVGGGITTSNINFTGDLYQNGSLYVSNSSQWTTTNGNIFYTGGNVGINNNNPLVALDVVGSSKISGGITTSSLYITSGSLINTFDSNTIGSTIFTTGGNIGIKTTAPTKTLDVTGTVNVSVGITTGALTANTISSSVLNLNTPSIGAVDVLNLNNGNLIGANSIRITDPGVNNEGLFFDGGNLWQISEASNALVNTSGNLQIIINGTRTATFETTGNFYIAGQISSGSLITSTLTTGTITATTGITTGTIIAISGITTSTITATTGITTGTLNNTYTGNSSSSSRGSLIVAGGVGISKSLCVGNNFVVLNEPRYPPEGLSANTQTLSNHVYGNGEYIVTASSSLNGNDYGAFDHSTGNWVSEFAYVATTGMYNLSKSTTVDSSSVLGEWLQIQCPETFVLNKIVINPSNVPTSRSARSFVMAGSNNGTLWTSLFSITSVQDWAIGIAKTFMISATIPYTYYRIIVRETGNFTSGGVSQERIVMANLELIGNNATKILTTYDSSSETTGALQVSGGVGIQNNLYAGGTITANTGINTSTLNASNGITTGALLANSARISSGMTTSALVVSSGSLKATFNNNTIGNIFTTGGNVGINNTSPTYKLDIRENSSFGIQGRCYTSHTAGRAGFLIQQGTFGGFSLQHDLGNCLMETVDSSGSILIYNYGSFVINDKNNSNAERFRIVSSSGNVGINNNNPLVALDVVGSSKISGGITTATLLATTSISTGQLFSTNISTATINVSTGITSPSLLITNGSNGSLTVNGMISLDNNGQGIIQRTSDPNHAIYLRKSFSGFVDSLSFYEFGDIQFYNGGNIASQSLRMNISSTGNVNIFTTRDSTNLTNGAFSIYGGVGISKNLHVGSTINSSSLSTGQLFSTNISTATINASSAITTGTINISSTSENSLVSNGGIKCRGLTIFENSSATEGILIDNSFNTPGNRQLWFYDSALTGVSNTSPSFRLGLFNGQVYIQAMATNNTSLPLQIPSVIKNTVSDDSLNTSSGGLIVSGGVGIAKSVNIGGNINVSGGITTGTLLATNIIGTNSTITTLIAQGILSGTFRASGSITTPSIYISSGSLNATFNNNTIGNIFTTGGNVGINNTSPSYKLDVRETSSFGIQGRFYTSHTTGRAGFLIQQGTFGGFALQHDSGNALVDTLDTIGSMLIYSYGSFIFVDKNNGFAERFRIVSSSGNVGINNNNPLVALDVVGSSKISGGITTSSLYITSGSLINTFNSNTIGSTIFTTGGNIGIGYTSPSAVLDVRVTGDVGNVISQFGSNSSNIAPRIILYDQTLSTTLGPRIYFNAGNVGIISGLGNLSLIPAGNVGIKTTAPTKTLDVTGTVNVSVGITTGALTANTISSSVLNLNTPSIGAGDVLNLNNGNLIGANSIRLVDPGVNNEGLFFDGGNLWQISEASNALVNTSGNLQIIINGTRTATFETTGNFYIAGRISSGSVITSTITTGNMEVTSSQSIGSTNPTTISGGALNVTGDVVCGSSVVIKQGSFAQPSFTTRSLGTKINVYPSISASSLDFAIGIEASHMWFTAPTYSSHGYKFYQGINNTIRIGEYGNTTFFSTTSSTNPTIGAVVISGGLGVSNIQVGSTITLATNTPSMYTWSGGAQIIGYCAGDTNFFSNTLIGDIAFRNTAKSLRFGTSVGESNFDVLTTGVVSINTTIESTAPTTGALVAKGGVGISKSLYVGGNILGKSSFAIKSLMTVGYNTTTTAVYTLTGVPTVTGNATISNLSYNGLHRLESNSVYTCSIVGITTNAFKESNYLSYVYTSNSNTGITNTTIANLSASFLFGYGSTIGTTTSGVWGVAVTPTLTITIQNSNSNGSSALTDNFVITFTKIGGELI